MDVKELIELQKNGIKIIDELPTDELDKLRYYGYLVKEAMVGRAKELQAPIDEAVLNVFKCGVAIGLMLQVRDGKIRRRETNIR